MTALWPASATFRCGAGPAAEVCNELDVPYLDLFTPFANDAAWDREQRAHDGTHTTADGYAMIATKVQNWPAWQSWLKS